MVTLEDRLVYVRKKTGYTQKELAKALGITARTVQRYEKDASCLTVNIATELSSLCEVALTWLLTGEENNDTSKLPIKHQDLSGKIPHEELIKYFEQQDLAWEINWDLLKLEKIDKSELQEIKKYIKFRLFEKEQSTSKNSSALDSGSDLTKEKKTS